MKRRSATAAAVLATLLLCAAPARAQQDTSTSGPAGKRYFTINVRYFLDRIPKNLQLLDFWFPMPQETEVQKVVNKSIRGPYPVETTIDPETANQYLYMKGSPRGGLGMQVHVSYDVERSQVAPRGLEPPAQPERTRAEKEAAEKASAQLRARWLRPETLMVLDDSVKSAASRATSGKRRPLDKARAIYDFVTTKMTLLEAAGALPGAGLGNLKFTLNQSKGDAADIATAFVGLCRAAGVPARNVTGVLIPTLVKQGQIDTFHHWAEFYLDGVGWVPADPAAGMRTPSKREWYFGALDENRLAISIGRDIVLVPAQHDKPLNFWATVYWEGDQKAMPVEAPLINYEELTELKNQFQSPGTTP